MRKTIVYGIDDKIRIDLGSDVDLICEIMEIGKYVRELTYEVEFSGARLKEFLNKFHINIEVEIQDDNKYLVTAYDW